MPALEIGEVVKTIRAASERYRELLNLADRVASKLAQSLGNVTILGRVSMLEQIGGDSVPVDIPPHVWVDISHRWPQILSPGYYVGIVDPKTLTLLIAVVEEARIASALAGLRGSGAPTYIGVEASSSPVQAAAYHMVSLRLLVKPVLAVHLGAEGAEKIANSDEPAVIVASWKTATPMVPPDPDSPVFIPKPELLETLLLAEHGDGVAVGALGVMDNLYVAGDNVVPVRLPWKTLVKHMLVTGTTGSGKTSFVKNLLLNAVRTNKAVALVLDANGDYVAAALPGYVPEELLDSNRRKVLEAVYGVKPPRKGPLIGPRLNPLIVIPYFSGRSLIDQCNSYAARLEELAKALYARLGCSIESRAEQIDEGSASCIVSIAVEDCKAMPAIRLKIPIVLRSIETKGSAARLAQIDPMLTERAREEIRRIHSICVRRFNYRVNSVGELYKCVVDNRDGLGRMGFHRETLNHIVRRLYALLSMGIVDSGGPDLDYSELMDQAEAFSRNKLRIDTVILDMEYAVTRAPREADPKAVKVLLVAKTIQTLIRYAEEGRRKTPYTIVVVDEAHLFFGSRSEEYTATMMSWLERLARLGRARGIAIIFSTHREDDVSSTVQTLCNTRVYFRLDERTAEKTPVPSHYRRRLPFFTDHAAVLASYAVRGGYVTIVSAPAVVGHRTA